MTKIAIIGSAPASIQLAPYDDPEWQIWGCSPGAYGVAGKYSHAWFELHRWEPQVPGIPGTGQPWFSPEYCEFLARHPGKVYTASPIPEVNNAQVFPFNDLIEKYSPYFFTSSIAWMLALALEQEGVEEIGLWGVDMAAHEEYAQQKPGCQHFLTMAVERGIKITIPPESDLLQPPALYGISENSPMMIKLTARKNELERRKFDAEQRMSQAQNEVHFLNGALDDLGYMIQNWVTYQTLIEPDSGKTSNEVRAEKIEGMRPKDVYAGARHSDQFKSGEPRKMVHTMEEAMKLKDLKPGEVVWVDNL
jgi:hypothetical protein